MKLIKFSLISLFVCCGSQLWAEPDVARLIEQLHGKAQYYNANGEELGFFASLTTRNYEEYTRIYAAKLLPKMVNAANRSLIVNALLEALQSGADDRDTGDGIVFNRTEIAFALAQINDESAVKPLLQKLMGTSTLPMINAKAGPAEIKIARTSSNLNIINALGTFTGLEAENAATMMEMLLVTKQDPDVEKHLLSSIELIRKGMELPRESYLRPSR
ncbi:MAG: hypothetical protein GQF41_3821 [Candidatus Rifleibacterium amylolyticum]|nr:MAG: hypothetical protein GQF41_3821 [Candidatus Rifleibacterium amylolyticum]